MSSDDTNQNKPVIGVLALQGCVTPHQPHIEAAGGIYKAVKTAAQTSAVDGLILPGGESTTMLKLIDRFGLEDIIREVCQTRPVWGICAGAILMAEIVTNPSQKSFACIPMEIIRNGYGSQIDSKYEQIQNYPVSFIRAPIIECILDGHEDDVKIPAMIDDKAVWVEYKDFMATTFHPELTLDFPSPMHQSFIGKVVARIGEKTLAA